MASILVVSSAVVAGAVTGPATVPSRAQGDVVPVTPAARSAGDFFLARYEQPDGRVVRWDQGGDTVSEGQSYAMLVAAALGRPGRFAAAWRWARRRLRQPTGLFAWHWQGGHVVDPSSAADADVGIASALALAAARFDDRSYAADAAAVASAVLEQEVATVAGRPMLVGGPWALGPPAMTDPSYFMPVAMARLAALGHPTGWESIVAGGRREIAELTAGGRLPPDWAGLDAQGAPYPTSTPGQGSGPVYGYDAVRIPVLLAASCAVDDRHLAARLWPVLAARVRRHEALVGLNLDGSGPASTPGQPPDEPVGLVGAAGAAQAAGRTGTAARLLGRAQAADRSHPTYYGSAWVALGRLMLETTSLGGCGPRRSG